MLSGLRAELRSCCKAGSISQLEKYVTSTGEQPADIGTELEICFRNEAREFDLKKEKEFQGMVQLLRFSIEFGKQYHAEFGNIGRTPFVLIADVLEREAISIAERVWSTVEELADDLISPALFVRGKMTVLRFCNALLRRLSKSCNTEFCGRILMFLAAIYPLSERSGVNVVGKFNTSNLTGFEEEADFEAYNDSAGHGCDMDIATAPSSDNGLLGEVELLLSKAKNQFSSASTENLNLVALESKEEVVQAIDYNLYKQFWKIQNFVAGDPGKGNAITPAVISAFSENADVVLSAFEANAFTSSELEQSLHSLETVKECAIAHTNNKLSSQESKTSGPAQKLQQNDDQATVNAYDGCKYLTSSQLFALQLKDPVIREQILAQLLFHVQFIKSKTVCNADSEKSLALLENRIHSILKKTPPNGISFLKSLKVLLDREQHWAAWKKKGCASFEKGREDAGPISTDSASVVGKKRKRGDVEEDIYAHNAAVFSGKIDTSTLKATLDTISKKIPSFDAHLETFMEAEDPEAGIEEAYHPKNDSIYCWRARRLLANKKLAAFEDMADGDVGKGLKKMSKLQPQPAVIATDADAAAPTMETKEAVGATIDESNAKVEMAQ